MDATDFVRFQINRSIVALFKNFLVTLEDLRYNKKISEMDFQRYRKVILDDGNGRLREIEGILDKVIINLK